MGKPPETSFSGETPGNHQQLAHVPLTCYILPEGKAYNGRSNCEAKPLILDGESPVIDSETNGDFLTAGSRTNIDHA